MSCRVVCDQTTRAAACSMSNVLPLLLSVLLLLLLLLLLCTP
jgi:hypothetical protein